MERTVVSIWRCLGRYSNLYIIHVPSSNQSRCRGWEGKVGSVVSRQGKLRNECIRQLSPTREPASYTYFLMIPQLLKGDSNENCCLKYLRRLGGGAGGGWVGMSSTHRTDSFYREGLLYVLRMYFNTKSKNVSTTPRWNRLNCTYVS
jgi:hypothetical protein